MKADNGTSENGRENVEQGRIRPVANEIVFIGSTLSLLSSGTSCSHSMILASAGGGSNLISTRNIGNCGFILLPPTSSLFSSASSTDPSSSNVQSSEYQGIGYNTYSSSSASSSSSWFPGASTVVLTDTGGPSSILDVVALLFSNFSPSPLSGPGIPPVIYIWIQAAGNLLLPSSSAFFLFPLPLTYISFFD
jgi:hypothetical protein